MYKCSWRGIMNNVFNKLGFFECVQVGNMVYGSLEDKNGLCSVNLRSGKATLLKVYENEKYSEQRLYHSLIKAGKYIVFIPANADKIALYNLDEGNLDYIDCLSSQKRKEPLYRNAVAIGDFVYIFGDTYKSILKMSLSTKKTIECLENNQMLKGEKKSYFGEGHAFFDNKLYIPLSSINALFVMDVNTGVQEYIKLELPSDGLGGIEQDGNYIWIVGKGERSNFLAKYNIYTSSTDLYDLPKVYDSVYPYWKPICTEGAVYLFPLLEEKAFVLKKGTDMIEELLAVSDIIKLNKGDSQFAVMGLRKNERKISFISGYDFKWYDLCIDTNELKEVKIKFSIKDSTYIDKFTDETMKQTTIINERRLPLDFYIGHIISGE